MACAGLIAAFNFAVDPLQLFRRPSFYPAIYLNDGQLQNAGLIRSEDFDTVLVGTSLAVHLRQSAINRHLGGRAVKLAISGASSRTQRFMIESAMVRHPKTVIWEMDYFAFREAPDVDSDKYLPADLYRKNLKGIAEYLFNIDTLREALWIVLRLWKPLDAVGLRLTWTGYLKFNQFNVDELNTMPVWEDLSVRYRADLALAAYENYRRQPGNLSTGDDYDTMVRNFERDAIDLIKAHPDLKFIVYFPPYAILHEVALRNFAPKTYDIFCRLSIHMLNRLASLPNVTLYDFRDVQEITHDLSKYFDTRHHSPVVDEKVLSFLEHGEHRVDSEHPAASIERLKAQVEQYTSP